METSGSNTDPYRNSSSGNGLRRYGVQFSASNFIQAPLTALLEYSGIFRGRSSHQESEALINGGVGTGLRDHMQTRLEESAAGTGGGEVAIRIIGAGEQEHIRAGPAVSVAQGREGGSGETGASPESVVGPDRQSDGGGAEGGSTRGGASSSSGVAPADSANGSADGETGNGTGANNRDSSYQRYDIQQAARWIEQILPFSLLLLVVFIRQHLQGFFVTIWIAAVMFKSNDILRKQTALKGERKFSVLVGITLVFMLHVVGVYWWYRNDDLLYPLVMLPPKEIPPFWHAVFIIMVNDTMVRQAAMVLKCILLMYYKNNRGRNYRKQGQMLTLVEYLLLLYRALLPTPVWYRFFLNKEYGSLFSSLTTGLYLTFKLTSVVEKVQSFFTALKALSRKEVHYGSYATTEQSLQNDYSHEVYGNT
ncbi:uncharacterized protein [Aristolochia californica]|uniref:uncharacterized protein isoform X2 n=1 Tax=Aristolochia californica TaxID=171875 RepID=UPI0035D6E2C0